MNDMATQFYWMMKWIFLPLVLLSFGLCAAETLWNWWRAGR